MSVCYKGCNERPPIVVFFFLFCIFPMVVLNQLCRGKQIQKALLQERLQYIGFLNELRAVV